MEYLRDMILGVALMLFALLLCQIKFPITVGLAILFGLLGLLITIFGYINSGKEKKDE